ncbi:hypothetical protein ACTXG7_29205 [Mycolicibacterium sp. Dal123E01]
MLFHQIQLFVCAVIASRLGTGRAADQFRLTSIGWVASIDNGSG